MGGLHFFFPERSSIQASMKHFRIALARTGFVTLLASFAGMSSLAQPVSLVTTRDSLTGNTIVQVSGDAGTQGSVQVSENLSQWSDLGPFVLAGVPFPIIDGQSKQRPLRFYRVSAAG